MVLSNDTSSHPPAVVPAELRRLPQWVACELLPQPDGSTKKIPYIPGTNRKAASTDPTTWRSYTEAHQFKRRARWLPAFTFTVSDHYTAIDLDHCRNRETGVIAPWAQAIIDRFPNAYIEISQGGAGLHLIVIGTKPDGAGCKKNGIEVYDRDRFLVMTGNVLPGHEAIGDCQAELDELCAELWPLTPAKPASTCPTLTVDDAKLIDDLRSEQGGKAARLLDGDLCGFPSASEARGSLAYKCLFNHATEEQTARILRASSLWNDRDKANPREQERKAARDAAQAVNDYTGEKRSPRVESTSGTSQPAAPQPQVIVGPVIAGETCGAERARIAELERENAQLRAMLAERDMTIATLRERARLSDEREAIRRNRNLAKAAPTAATLATLFRSERPREPDSAMPYRMPLKKLAEATGLSEGTCSDHLRLLATYQTPDGVPILHHETRDIPRQVDEETGEIIEPHREVWIGPGVDVAAFGPTLATLTPHNAPKHGGDRRDACANHPGAGTIRRETTSRRITIECAECHEVLDTQVVTIGRERRTFIPAPPLHQDALMMEEPIEQDAAWDDPAPIEQDAPLLAPSRHPTRPMQQLASSLGNHVEENLSGKLPDSPSSRPADDSPRYSPEFWAARSAELGRIDAAARYGSPASRTTYPVRGGAD